MRATILVVLIASAGCTDEPADSLQGLTSTFPCLAPNLGLVGHADCAAQDEIVLRVRNECAQPLMLPSEEDGGVSALEPDDEIDYPVQTQFVTGDESRCSVSIPVSLGGDYGTISFWFE